MALINKFKNGETQLNKLKFKPNMDQGLPPIVRKRIPTGENPKAPFSGNAISTRIDDLQRIGTLLVRNQGLKFIGNNSLLKGSIALSKQSSLDETGLKEKLKTIKNAVANPNFLGDTATLLFQTIKQVGVSGTGTHFVRGTLDRDVEDKKYLNQAIKKNPVFDSLGQPGAVYADKDKPVSEGYKKENVITSDLLNKEAPYEGTEKAGPELADYIKFNFEVLAPEKDKKSVFLHFRAFLDMISDNYSGNWNSYHFNGRGENFYTYEGFDRQVSIGFKVAAMSKEELKPIYQKLVYLASTTAPTYSKEGFKRGTIVKMTVGDYIVKTPGFLSSVNYEWSSDLPMDINIGRFEGYEQDKEVQALPTVLNVNLQFTPIHSFTPQTGLEHYITNPEGENVFFDTPGENYRGGLENIK